MREFTMKSFRYFLLTLTVVCLSASSLYAQTCPPATKPAREVGPIAPNGPWIASQCPEACDPKIAGRFEELFQDYGGSYIDYITVWCGAGYSTPIPSTSTCWNCEDGCAGSNCPAGSLCMPIANQTGSDCRQYVCDDPAYAITEDSATGVPYCRRKQDCADTLSVTLDGPMTIRTGTSCTWSAITSGGNPNTGRSYTWYVSNNPVGYAQWYTGGRPSGTLVGAGWRLRVTVTDGSSYASSEFVVSESSCAPLCMQ